MAKSTVPVELPGDPTADLHASTKGYVDTTVATKAGIPFFGAVPSGSTTPTITHDLGTADVDVTVWRVADGIQVGVPVDRVDGNNVQLTFATAPTAGQYRVVVSAGTGAGGSGGGGGGMPDAHAFTHATVGSDPVSPESIGAAADDHEHVGVYSPVVHNHNGLAPTSGTTNQVLTKNTDDHYDYSWQDAQGGGGGGGSVKPFPPVDLPDSDPINVDASAGTHFRVTITGTRTINTPTNPTPGQMILFEITASGAARTINLGAGFGTGADFIALAQVQAGKTDYIQCIYDERVTKWQVISYVKGYN